MPTHRSPLDAGRSALEVFIGEWTEQVLLPDIPPGRVSFEWALDGQFLIQRSEIPQPEFPDSIALVAYDGDAETYTQHYFDSRGVVRIYKMSLRDGVWTLLRDEPDFTPLEFMQRFEGTFSDDSNSIDARWEASRDGGATWDLDFTLTYTRDS